jgi:hypothetical protein
MARTKIAVFEKACNEQQDWLLKKETKGYFGSKFISFGHI